MKLKFTFKGSSIVAVGIFSIALKMLASTQLSHAHNRVVVVPLGEDISPLDPTASVAKADPSQTDYNFSNFFPIVFDRTTNLEWQRADDDDPKDWNEALDYCSDLDLGGQTDWRLPDIIELQSIVDYGSGTPGAPIIDIVAFPGTNQNGYWTASNQAGDSNRAWFVEFFDGSVDSFTKVTEYFVRCVR